MEIEKIKKLILSHVEEDNVMGIALWKIYYKGRWFNELKDYIFDQYHYLYLYKKYLQDQKLLN